MITFFANNTGVTLLNVQIEAVLTPHLVYGTREEAETIAVRAQVHEPGAVRNNRCNSPFWSCLGSSIILCSCDLRKEPGRIQW